MTGTRQRLRITHVPAWLIVAVVRAYQYLISPWLGAHCRFHPTCSAYFIEAVQQHGAFRGSWMGIRRILRCHPFHPGGYDPVANNADESRGSEGGWQSNKSRRDDSI